MILKNSVRIIGLLTLASAIYSCGKGTASTQASEDSIIASVDSLVKDSLEAVESETETSTYRFKPGKKVSGKLIALTFDDGPNSQSTPKILSIMEQYHTVCSFMVVGRYAEIGRDYLKRATALGCEICNHTWEHPFLSTISKEERIETIEKTNKVIREVTGHNPNFFRPPYIDCDQEVMDDVPLPGLNGCDSQDWKPSTTPDQIYQNVMKQAAPGAIVVMHDISHNKRTPEALKRIVPALLKEGYTLVTVTDLFTSLSVTPQLGSLYLNPNRSHVPKSEYTKRGRASKGKKKA